MNNTLKSLQTRRAKLQKDLEECRRERTEVHKLETEIQNSLSSVDKQIGELVDKKPVVSEHAIIRYLERVKGMDIDLIRREILTEKNVETIKTIGRGKIPIGNGFKLVVKDNIVVSVTL